jgi:hypothetical protein
MQACCYWPIKGILDFGKKTEKRLLNETWLFRQNLDKTTFHVITQISPKKIINMRGL